MFPTVFAAPKYTQAQNAGLLVIRAALAAVFLYHGSQKLFGAFGGYGIRGTAGFMESIGIPFPLVSTVLAASAEFFGGVALLLGILPRLAAIPMAFTMAVAIATVHHSAFDARANGMEYPLTLGLTLVGIALVGGGDWNVVELVKKGFGARGQGLVESTPAQVASH